MTTRTAYAPRRICTSEKISPDAAQAMLASYLERATTDASLHPDAMLTAMHYGAEEEDEDEENCGVKFPQSGPKGGLILHHLRRIEAGLRGEDLAAQSREELKALFSEEIPDEPLLKLGGPVRKTKQEQSVEKVNEWSDTMDIDEYARKQEIVDDEIGADLDGQGEQVEEPEVATTVDKTARKAAKKARRKAEKKQAAG